MTRTDRKLLFLSPVMPKPGGTFPQGHMQLMEFAVGALRDVTGINLELVGLKDVNQPGILEAIRTQLGLKEGDAAFFVAGDPEKFWKFAGLARTRLGEDYMFAP